jgi:hypothetical protein
MGGGFVGGDGVGVGREREREHGCQKRSHITICVKECFSHFLIFGTDLDGRDQIAIILPNYGLIAQIGGLRGILRLDIFG